MVKIDKITIEFFYNFESESEDIKKITLSTSSPLIANRVYLNHEDIVHILCKKDRYIDYDYIFYKKIGSTKYILLNKQTKFLIKDWIKLGED